MFLRPHKKTLRTFKLILVTFFYLIFGALVFEYLEHAKDIEVRKEIKMSRDMLQNKYNFTVEDFERFERMVVDTIPGEAGRQWNFLGSVFFCVVVITTIGYGHSTPNSFAGKLFYIGFALIGIPLGLISFQSAGERINTGAKYCLLKLRAVLAKFFGIHILKEVKARHLLTISLSLGISTIVAGTIVFHREESWSLFDSFYYCVITLSTIGLGDRVAAQTNGRLDTDPLYVIFTLLFILVGLAIFSACINLLVLEFMETNPDIVTARKRLRRLLQRSASLKGTPFTSFSSVHTRSQKPKDISNSNKKGNPSDKQIQSMYIHRQNPVKFTVRRPASVYIDHLVHTQTSRV